MSKSHAGMKEGDLAKILSEWSRKELACEISPDALQALFFSVDLKKAWTHIVKNVVSVTPTLSYKAKHTEITKPAPPELLSDYKRLLKQESVLDLEIATLEKDLKVASAAATSEAEKNHQLCENVKDQSAKIQLLNTYRLHVERDLGTLSKLHRKIDTALSIIPSSDPKTVNTQQLVSDIHDSINRLHEYYEASNRGIADVKLQSVHSKVKEMVKSYTSDQYVKELCKCIDEDTEGLRVEPGRSDVQMVGAEIEASLSDLQQSYVDTFFATQPLHSRVEALETEKKVLLQKLLDVIKSKPNYSQMVELHELKLNTIQRQEMIKSLSNLQFPDGMPSFSDSDVEEVQHQIENKNKEVINQNHQIVRLFNTNKVGLHLIRETLKDDPLDDPNQLIKCKLQDSKCNSFKFLDKHLLNIGERLSNLQTWEDDINDLCVRPGQKRMSVLVKTDLQSALRMPSETAPEKFAECLLDRCEVGWNNVQTRKVQKRTLELLNVNELFCKGETVVKGVLNADKKTESVISKADAATNRFREYVGCNEVKDDLATFMELPAFKDNVL